MGFLAEHKARKAAEHAAAERQAKIDDLKASVSRTAEAGKALTDSVVEATRTLERVLARVKAHDAKQPARFTYQGVTLVETRVHSTRSTYAFASTPVKIGGMRFRVGGMRPVGGTRSEELTVIDQGDFLIEAERAAFAGGLQTRTWDFKKVVGYDTEGNSELLINVSNRQKTSGVRYGAEYDWEIESVFLCAVELFNGNRDEVMTWVSAQRAELQSRIDQAKAMTQTDEFKGQVHDLVELLGADEARAYLSGVPGLTLGE